MIITSKTGEKLDFLPAGVREIILVLNHVAFRGQFDENCCNDWEKSTGKKLLQEWAEKNLPDVILEQFEVDIPTKEEVFSQKMLNLYESSRKDKSKQFHIFKDSDERMKEFEGKPVCWWTRSADAGGTYFVWCVNPGGSMGNFYADSTYGFVPVLRWKYNERIRNAKHY